MGRRSLLLVAAVVLAGLGATLVFWYAHGADQRAAQNQTLRAVLVATSTIPAGTTAASLIGSGSVQLRQIASGSVAPGALSNLAAVGSLTTLEAVFAGEQLLIAQFGATTALTSLPIPDGLMAVSVQLGDPERVAGFVTAGSQVAVFVTIANTDPATSARAPDTTEILLTRVSVIGVGNTSVVTQTSTNVTGQQNTEQIPKTILTLAVNQDEATRLIHATQKGSLYFALLTTTSKVALGGGVDSSNLLP
jgi:pilus assembly protein CpaB